METAEVRRTCGSADSLPHLRTAILTYRVEFRKMLHQAELSFGQTPPALPKLKTELQTFLTSPSLHLTMNEPYSRFDYAMYVEGLAFGTHFMINIEVSAGRSGKS